MSRVLTCMSFDDSTQTCNAHVWQEQPSVWPQLTVEQGAKIGQEFFIALLTVAAIKVFLNPKNHRSSRS